MLQVPKEKVQYPQVTPIFRYMIIGLHTPETTAIKKLLLPSQDVWFCDDVL
jgi:hypothetical protein